MPNFLFVEGRAERRQDTERMFAEIGRGVHEAWLSDLYFLEILRTPDLQLREQLAEIPAKYGLQILTRPILRAASSRMVSAVSGLTASASGCSRTSRAVP